MVGTQPLPGVTRLNAKGKPTPVLPSDHFGLLMRMRLRPGLQPKAAPRGAAAAGVQGQSSFTTFSGSGHVLGGGRK